MTQQTATAAEIITFLRGDGELEGCAFGEKPEGAVGNFWWRKYLPFLVSYPPHDGPCEVRQEDREAAKALLDRLHIREHETGSFRSWDETVQAFARHRQAFRQQSLPGEGEVERVARDLLANIAGTYKARNGREVGIEANDGEKCWIVHSDYISALEGALNNPQPENPAWPSSSIEREWLAIADRDCETLGLEDMEGGCCAPCRARAAIAALKDSREGGEAAAMIALASPSKDGAVGDLCGDCPPTGYPTDATRCAPCPRRNEQGVGK